VDGNDKGWYFASGGRRLDSDANEGGAPSSIATATQKNVLAPGVMSTKIDYAGVYGTTSPLSGTVAIFFNGVAAGYDPAYQVAGNVSPTNCTRAGIGRRFITASPYYHNGVIAEFVAYDRMLSPAEFAQVNAYLMGKWSIAPQPTPSPTPSQTPTQAPATSTPTPTQTPATPTPTPTQAPATPTPTPTKTPATPTPTPTKTPATPTPTPTNTPPPLPVGNKAIFGYGDTGSPVSMTNLVTNTGVVGNDVTGVGTARYSLAAAGYGTDKAIFGYGINTVSFVSMTNLVTNTGVVGNDVAGTVAGVWAELAAAGYGTDKAIFGYGAGIGFSISNTTNLVTNTGVVGNDVAGVGTARRGPAAAGYG
jgi:hypothetical protein